MLLVRLSAMQPGLMLNWFVVVTSSVVGLDLVSRVSFTQWLVCFCNMVFLLAGGFYSSMHPMLLTVSTVLHCCGMYECCGLAALGLSLILTVAGQHW